MQRLLCPRNLCLIMGLVAFHSSGCSETFSPQKVQVSGTVERNGQPINRGFVFFSPVDPEAGQLVMADIENGKYLTQAKEGVTAGQYKIVVSAASPQDETKMMSGKYSAIETTNFEISITGNDPNVVKDLKLED